MDGQREKTNRNLKQTVMQNLLFKKNLQLKHKGMTLHVGRSHFSVPARLFGINLCSNKQETFL